MPSPFVHLHTHTEFSMLDGASRVKDLARKAAEDGQPAIAATDHGNMYGAVDFYRACEQAGVKPIIGTELYQAHDSRFERLPQRGKVDDTGGDSDRGRKQYYHLTALAMTNEGYGNLRRLSSRAFLEGFHTKPRVDWDLLDQYSKGIVATTGCLGGHVLQSLLRGDEGEALQKAALLQDIFGKENLYVEIQDHGIPEQRRTNPALVRIAQSIGAPLVAVNDSHYVDRKDALAHDALLCCQTGSHISDPHRFKFHGDEHYFKTAREMRELFDNDFPGACDSTLEIAERADVKLEFGSYKLPEFPVPQGFEDDKSYLRHLVREGSYRLWGNPLPPEVVERMRYELGVVESMGFPSYFLILWDIVEFAKSQGIRTGVGRGSAAGCAIAYSLGITGLDPLKYGLMFERFLNPSRVSMPDIDLDIDSRYRDVMINYVAEKYGRDHVAQIVTFSQIRARSAVRDAARVLEKPYAVGDKIAKAMPPLMQGRPTPLGACFEEDPDYLEGFQAAQGLREMYEQDLEVQEVVDVAKGLEGLRRSDGIHAAAVVISPDPLIYDVPLQRKDNLGGGLKGEPVVTQYEMHGVEDLGLLKMDFLGLTNLDIITDTLTFVKERHGVDLDINAIPMDDPETFATLQAGETIGVFQLEGGAMRGLLRSLRPDSFEDVAALVALYRPGPMASNMHNDYADRKNGRQSAHIFHPDAEEILGNTYNLCIYQEQMTQIAQKFAGYTAAEGDLLRKAAGKKLPELMKAERSKFVKGCIDQGYGEELGNSLFSMIEPWSAYGFNAAHAYSYGFIAYQTAYLKTHYSVEYMASLLTAFKSSLDKCGAFIADCARMGIRVLPPDVNRSGVDFMPHGEDEILYGLSAVRDVGESIGEAIIAERESGGEYKDFHDFASRLPQSALGKKGLVGLTNGGAFDSMGYERKGLAISMGAVVDALAETKKREAGGQFDLFSGSVGVDVPITREKHSRSAQMALEREFLGLYISDHPLEGMDELIESKRSRSIAEVLEDPGGFEKITGVVAQHEVKWTKKGDRMATLEIQDRDASIPVVVFPQAHAELGQLLKRDTIVMAEGRIDVRDDGPQMILKRLEVLRDTEDDGREVLGALEILLPQDFSDATTGAIKGLPRGDARVLVTVPGGTVELSPRDRLDPSPETLESLLCLPS